MIISDLQHIESATEIEFQGGWGGKYVIHRPKAQRSGDFGTNTKTFTSTDTLIIEGQFSDFGFTSSFESF